MITTQTTLYSSSKTSQYPLPPHGTSLPPHSTSHPLSGRQISVVTKPQLPNIPFGSTSSTLSSNIAPMKPLIASSPLTSTSTSTQGTSLPTASTYRPIPKKQLPPNSTQMHRTTALVKTITSSSTVLPRSIPKKPGLSTLPTAPQLPKKRPHIEKEESSDESYESSSESDSSSDDSDFASKKVIKRKAVGQHQTESKDVKKKKLWSAEEITHILKFAKEERYKCLGDNRWEAIQKDHFPNRTPTSLYSCYYRNRELEAGDKTSKAWTKAEEARLCSTLKEYEAKSATIEEKTWEEIQKNFFPDRSVGALRQHYTAIREEKSSRFWSQKEIKKILDLAESDEYKDLGEERWPKIQKDHFPTRTADAVSICYHKHRKLAEGEKKRKLWTKEDEAILHSFAENHKDKFGRVSEKDWETAQKDHFPDRTVQAIAMHYIETKNEKTRKLWSPEETAKLLQYVKDEPYKNLADVEKFQKIRQDHFPERSFNAVLNHYYANREKEEGDITPKPWTKAELEIIQKSIAEGKTYKDIYHLFPDRTEVAVKQRFRKLEAKPTTKIQWTDENNEMVNSLYEKHKDTPEKQRWAKMATDFSNHISKPVEPHIIKRHYFLTHRSETPRIEWTQADNQKLLEAVEKHKDSSLPSHEKWDAIAKEMNRTTSAVLQQHRKLTQSDS